MNTNYIDFPINPSKENSVEGGINDPDIGLYFRLSVPRGAGGYYRISSSGLPLYAVLYQEDTSATVLPQNGTANGSFTINATLFGNTNYELFVMTTASLGGTFDLTCECLRSEPWREVGKEIPMTNSSANNYAADPVDIGRGAYTAKYDLLRFAGGQNLCFSACYDSSVPAGGVMGKGWYHNFEKRIAATAIDSDGVVLSLQFYETPQNYIVFDRDESGKFVCRTPGKEDYDILPVDDGFRVFYIGRGYEDYNAELYGGKLIRVVNQQGQKITLNHDTENVVKIYDDLTGKYIQLNMNPNTGKLQSVQDAYGRSVSFTYDNDGNLLEFVDLNGQKFKFHYDNDRMMAMYKLDDSINSPIEYLALMNYYSPDGKIGCQESATGLASYFGYKENGEYSFKNRNGDTSYRTYNSLGLITSYTDENGNTTTYTYDNSGNMLTETDALGKTKTMEYNEYRQPTKIIDKNGKITTLTYDAKGNLTSIHHPNAGKEEFTYDGSNCLIKYKDQKNLITVFTYDHDGRLLTKKVGDRPACTYTYTNGLLTRETDAKGNATIYAHNSYGFMTSKTDALNRTTTYTYDKCGNLLSVTDPLNNTTVYEYNKDGQKISETDANGHKTKYAYNRDALLTQVTFPDNTTLSYGYDSAEYLICVTDQMGGMTNITNDAGGRVLSKRFPDGGIVSYTYDAVGNVLTETNPLGGVTTRAYDAMGHVLTETAPDGTETDFIYDEMGRMIQKFSSELGSCNFNYSTAGLRTWEEDGPGREVYYGYDIYGNKISERIGYDYDHITTFTYDANNNLLTATDRLGNTTSFEYDACNQCVKVTDARNNSTLYGYDLCGRRTTVTDARGNTVTTTYDQVGNVLSVTDAKGNVILSKTYNNRNLPVTVTDANGTRTYAYNAMGKPISVTDAIGTKQFAYDDMGRNTQVTDEAEGVSTTTFNAMGLPLTVTGPGGAVTTYTYDNMGRKISQTTPSGGTVTYSNFHYSGKPKQMIDARGNVHQYLYDTYGRICSHTASWMNETYTYDPEGNPLTSSDGSHTVSRTYDLLNRMVSYNESDVGAIEYTYDSVGNIVDIDGDYACICSYDANNNLISARDMQAHVEVSYTYDGNNKLLTETKPDGSVTTYTYDAFQRLASKIARNSADEMIIGYEYTYDARGRLATEKDLVKNRLMCYTYDNRDWVTNRRTIDLATEEYTDDPFTYDPAGNLQNLIGDNTPAYDSNNRLTEYKGTTLHYDADGNMTYHSPTGIDVPLYSYDAKNRLTGNQIEFFASYNADNVRYLSTDQVGYDFPSYTYLYDTNRSLSRVLCRRNSHDPSDVIYYLHGLGLVCEYDNLDVRTYHFDYRGSTVAITDMSGNIIDTFEYDTYGKMVSHTGSTDTPYQYNGRDGVMTDPNGLLYMRARYYSPDMRRFISADILPGGIDNAVTLNRYAYANANPVTNIDPFGLCAERGQLGPTALEAAHMAQHIYNPEAKLKLKDWTYLSDEYYAPLGEYGVIIGVYKREIHGVIEYAVVNKGTTIDNAANWVNNALQIGGASPDAWMSIAFAEKFVNDHPGAHITFVGHSKGGAEATMNALATNKDAIVFNPAKPNYAAYGISPVGYDKNVTSYIISGEALSLAYAGIGMLPLLSAEASMTPWLFDDFLTSTVPTLVHSSPRIGNIIPLKNPDGSIIEDHSMESIIKALGGH